MIGLIIGKAEGWRLKAEENDGAGRRGIVLVLLFVVVLENPAS